jgi:hypothetical protein
VDHTGSRVITGGMDYNVHMYDFSGMKSDLKPFVNSSRRRPYVAALSFNPSSETYLCVPGPRRPRCMWKDVELRVDQRGDMYMRDLKNHEGTRVGLL